MRNIFIMALCIAAFWGGFFSPAAQASLIANEDFESYASDASLDGLNGGTGWGTSWDLIGTHGTTTIARTHLGYSAGQIAVDGGSQALQHVAGAGETGLNEVLAARQLAAAQNSTVYMSFLYRTQTVSGASAFYQVGMNPTAGNPSMSVFDNGTFQGRIGTSGGTDTTIPSNDSQTYLVVLKSYASGGNYSNLAVFVNPTSLDENSNTKTSFSGSGPANLDYLVLRKAFMGAASTYLTDAVRVGSTFLDVVTPPTVFKTSGGNGADTFVEYRTDNAGAVNVNHGTETVAQIKNAGDPPGSVLSRKGYFRFNVHDLLGDTRATLANLFLTAEGSSGAGFTFSVYGLNDGAAGENWGETAITWNNAPGNDTASLDGVLTGDTTLLGTFPGVGGGTTLSFSNQALVDFLNADTDGLVTLIITRSHDSLFAGPNNQFRTKEWNDTDNLYAPRLAVTTAVPEPATMALLGLAASGLAGYLRRRRTA